ncbi:MAG: hypothetical protein M3Y76_13205 [Chloroflexota bacterium]|nr:hypothetical protein [Chloroflexota bacterium]
MQQSQRRMQRLSLAVFPIPSQRGNPPTNTPAQRVIVPICRRGVSKASR